MLVYVGDVLNARLEKLKIEGSIEGLYKGVGTSCKRVGQLKGKSSCISSCISCVLLLVLKSEQHIGCNSILRDEPLKSLSPFQSTSQVHQEFSILIC